jgi:hypothetical protein
MPDLSASPDLSARPRQIPRLAEGHEGENMRHFAELSLARALP